MITWRAWIAGGIALAGLAAPASAQVLLSGFAASVEGWTIVSFSNLAGDGYSIIGTYSASFSASGGHPDGYIFTTDPDGGDFTFAAPASVRAALAGSFGRVLTYDLLHSSGVIDYQGVDVVLEGGGLRLVWQSSPALIPSASWLTVSVPLAPSAQWHLGGTTGALASASDFQTVLANVTGFYIRGEFTNGAETAGLDSVTLVPEPPTTALLAVGTLAGAWGAWRSCTRNRHGAFRV